MFPDADVHAPLEEVSGRDERQVCARRRSVGVTARIGTDEHGRTEIKIVREFLRGRIHQGVLRIVDDRLRILEHGDGDTDIRGGAVPVIIPAVADRTDLAVQYPRAVARRATQRTVRRRGLIVSARRRITGACALKGLVQMPDAEAVRVRRRGEVARLRLPDQVRRRGYVRNRVEPRRRPVRRARPGRPRTALLSGL